MGLLRAAAALSRALTARARAKITHDTPARRYDRWLSAQLARELDQHAGDPCPVCGRDDWPAGSAGNARRIHELDQHEGDPRIKPRWVARRGRGA